MFGENTRGVHTDGQVVTVSVTERAVKSFIEAGTALACVGASFSR
jgi:hypothetical protein